jgi:hypothetical protein
MVDRTAFGRVLASIERLDPTAIISGHLPVARGITRNMLDCLDRALAAGKIHGPDHATMERLMAA